MRYAYAGKEIYPVIEIYHDLIPYLGGISEKTFYMDAENCARAWKTANEAITDFFGEYCPPRAPTAAPLSYGHLISLGAPYTLPEDSEPNVRPFADDIDEALSILDAARGKDFGDNRVCRHYIEVNRYLKSVFPDKNIPPLSGYGMEGVITTAVLMRGQDFFVDLYEEPEKSREFLEKLNRSIIDFCRWQSVMNGQDPVSKTGAYLCDDFAALIPPKLWDEFVVPYWDAYYSARSTGSYRFLHCEGVSPEQLKFMSHAKITRYQPSVSEKLTLKDMKANLDIPYDWLLYAWKVTQMSDKEISAWVDETVEAGVFKIRTQLGKFAWMTHKLDRLMSFMRAFDKYRIEEAVT